VAREDKLKVLGDVFGYLFASGQGCNGGLPHSIALRERTSSKQWDSFVVAEVSKRWQRGVA